MNRILTLIIALAAVFAFAEGSIGPDSALAHHRPGHAHGPPSGDAEPTATSTSPQPTPTSVAPQPTPTPGPTATPEPTRTPLDEGERYGWGCGDQNHEHVGPAGNPDAESPCDKHESDDSAMAASADDA